MENLDPTIYIGLVSFKEYHCITDLWQNKFWILRKASPAPTTVLNFGFGSQTTVLNHGLGSPTTVFNLRFGSRTIALNFWLCSRTTEFNSGFGIQTIVLNIGLDSRTIAVTSWRRESSNINLVLLDELLFVLSKPLFEKLENRWQTDRRTGPPY